MTSRGLTLAIDAIYVAFLCTFIAWMCVAGDAGLEAKNVRPVWTATAWVMHAPCPPAWHVEGRVWFDDDAQCFQWTVLRTGRNLPDGPQWRTGASKTEREAKAAAKAAIGELQ